MGNIKTVLWNFYLVKRVKLFIVYFSMPIDDAILEHIKSIDWEHKAEGLEL